MIGTHTPTGKTLDYKEYARQAGGAAPGTLVVESLAAVRQPPPAARLVCVHPPGELLGRLVELRPVPALVGRDEGSDIPVAHPSVSRAHARIEPRPDGAYVVTDLGSSNGTRVNREVVRSRALRHGDRVHFGGTIFLHLTGDGL